MLKLNQNAIKFYRGENGRGEKQWASNPFSEQMQEETSFSTKYVTLIQNPQTTQKQRDALMKAYCFLQEQNYQWEDYAMMVLREAYLSFFKEMM